MIMIGQLVSEIFMFESVDGCTDGRQLESHTISSPWAFGSGELKSKWATTCDFQQCDILVSVDSDKHMQPPFKSSPNDVLSVA